MNMAVASLLALAVSIIVGFVLNINVGILAIALAYLIGLIYGVGSSQIISGFSSSMAITMIGVLYLFGIITKNGTLETLARKITKVAERNKYLLYVAMFLIGMLLSGVGPGAIPTLAIAPVLAIPVAIKAGINPVLLTLIGQMGAQAVRMCPITPEAIVVANLMEEQGLSGNTIPAMWCLFVTEICMAIGAFIVFKGWKFADPIVTAVEEQGEARFNSKQLISLVGLAAMIISVVVFDCNVGLVSFLIGTILLALKCGDDKAIIKSIPWNTILLVLGMGVLMNIVKIAGGVELLSNSIASICTDTTATPLMCVVAGVMSFFASGLGVVFPTLVPTVGGIAAGLSNVNPTELMAAVVIGGTITGFTPISTAGALALAGASQFEELKDIYPEKKMFIDLCIIAFLSLAISVVLAFAGVYRMICG